MRAWLYDTLVNSTELQSLLGVTPDDMMTRVMPRRSRSDVLVARPFLIYGLGNSTSEQLSDSTSGEKDADRQFFQIWVHDDGGDYGLIDRIIDQVIKILSGQRSSTHRVLTITYLETSQEFNNETYNTLFRYIRFQAIRVREGTSS